MKWHLVAQLSSWGGMSSIVIVYGRFRMRRCNRMFKLDLPSVVLQYGGNVYDRCPSLCFRQMPPRRVSTKVAETKVQIASMALEHAASAPMHHCLYISEVLYLIFKFVRQCDVQLHQGPPVGKKTLASLARTCHLFSSPALDVLWQDLYSFCPLIEVLPIVCRSSRYLTTLLID